MAPTPAYRYRAVVRRVTDGDTLVLDISLGLGVWLHNQPVRLLGCNARESHDPGGREARDHLAALLPVGSEVIVDTVQADKYARYDARVTLDDGTDLVAQLIADGWVAPWDGRGVRPVPPWPRTAEPDRSARTHG